MSNPVTQTAVLNAVILLAFMGVFLTLALTETLEPDSVTSITMLLVGNVTGIATTELSERKGREDKND